VSPLTDSDTQIAALKASGAEKVYSKTGFARSTRDLLKIWVSVDVSYGFQRRLAFWVWPLHSFERAAWDSPIRAVVLFAG